MLLLSIFTRVFVLFTYFFDKNDCTLVSGNLVKAAPCHTILMKQPFFIIYYLTILVTSVSISRYFVKQQHSLDKFCQSDLTAALGIFLVNGCFFSISAGQQWSFIFTWYWIQRMKPALPFISTDIISNIEHTLQVWIILPNKSAFSSWLSDGTTAENGLRRKVIEKRYD